MKNYFKYAFYFAFCLIYFNSSAQQSKLDSLKKLLKSAKDDTTKIILLDGISELWPPEQPDTILSNSIIEYELAKKQNWELGFAISVYDKALYYYYSRSFDTSITLFNEAIDRFKKLYSQKRLGLSYYSIGYVYLEQGNFVKSLDAFLKSLSIFEKLDDYRGLSQSLGALGTVYIYQNNYKKANEYLVKAIDVAHKSGVKSDEAHALMCLGENHCFLEQYDLSEKELTRALELYTELKNRNFTVMTTVILGNLYASTMRYGEALGCYAKILDLNAKEVEHASPSYLGAIGQIYLGIFNDTNVLKPHPQLPKSKKEAISQAVKFLKVALEGSIAIGQIDNIRIYSRDLSLAQKLSGDYASALANYELFITFRDSVFSTENRLKFKKLETEREVQLKEKQIVIDKLAVAKKRNERGYFAAGMALLIGVIGIVFRNYKNQKESNRALTYEKKRSDDLLLNILPSEIAEELKASGKSEARYFDDVTVMFTDFVNFTTATVHMTPQELVAELDACFKAFDAIISKYNIEKIKTVGDAYLAVSGLPVATPDHAANVVKAALEIRDFMQSRKAELGEKSFHIRVGIHSGSVVAGIVGVKKFAYDIWGDTVNTAARMEQNSLAGKVNASESTYLLVKDKFKCEYRGEINAKNKGQLKMYFIE